MKYYKEIENGLCLSINKERRIYPLADLVLPNWFYEKYQSLIDFIPKIKNYFDNFLLDKYYLSLSDKEYFEFFLQRYKKISLKTTDNLNGVSRTLEMKNCIQIWGNILEFMFSIDNTLMSNDYFIYIMELFNQALIDIGDFDGALAKHYLPNKWLLTSNGSLYNMKTTAHEGGFYYKYYNEKIEWFLNKEKTFAQIDNENLGKIKILPEFDDTSIIKKNGYIREQILDDLFHFIDYFEFNKRIYDSKMIMIAIGTIELHMDLINFLRILEIETDNPKENLREIMRIINNKYLDFLIRCCGVSKVSFLPKKTIITSRLTAKDDFKEYLDNGYDVCFVPPIIINHETKSVEELNMNSPIISRYIENEILYEDKFAKVKIYTNHI